ncbi:predicted protein [Naegleria gruberi]|uniref:Predicted protein n=1 Tax=Naegleria gruberi TaxID=5762 RepID=D2VE17_NAEGR|nr:uncharacterized protein NAEGRDRAFT_67117 [Naegleria gruberi]EFC44999.1 predicted protein [Naegleria gruberi]|eukprot:XP_002677743.1 predicted protein [Naegleria gruberi strain NEG-M]
MFRGGKPTASRVSTNIQKPSTNRVLPSSASSKGGTSASSGVKGVVTTPSTPKTRLSAASSVVRTSSSSQPQPSKSPSNIGKNNIHYNHRNPSEDISRESNNSKIEEEDDDDMEIMSVNDQYQYLKDSNKSKDQNSSIKSIRSSRSSKSNRSTMSEMGMSDDSIPLKMKKKVQIETPRERDYRDSRDSSSTRSIPTEEQNEDFGEEQSVSSSNNSLHILSSVRRKLKEEEAEEEQPVNNNPRPSRIAEYIKRFRTAPPTQRSERKRLEFEDEKEEPIPVPRNERRKSPELESLVTNSREDNRSWMKRAMQSSIDSSHPSIRNINQMKESIKQEIMDVEDNIERAKRYSQFNLDEEEALALSTQDHFSYMDTLDFNINELNNITDLALENGSFKMFGNVESILSKLSNEKTNQSKDSINSEKKMDETSDSSDEEKLDEMFRKGVLSRLQSIGLHESYLDLESYDILSSNEKPKIENVKVDKLDELKKESEQVEKLLQGKKSRENSIILEKEKELPKLTQKDSNHSILSSVKSSSQSLLSEEKSPSKYEISIDHEDMEEGFFPVVTIKSDKSGPVVSQSMESLESDNSAFESRQLDFVDEEELIQRQKKSELTPPMMTESIDSLLGKSIESVSSVSSANDNDMSTMGYCQRMIEQMVSSEPEPEPEKPIIEKSIEKKEVIDINDDNHELFTNDYICQTLRQKIDQLKSRLVELEKKDSLLKY